MIEPDVDEELPALYNHCVRAFELMEQGSRESGIDEEAKLIWEGHLTKLIAGQMHLSTPYYTGITRALIGMGCIRQLRRGGGSSESQWEIVKAPTPELWRNLGGKKTRLYTQPVSTLEQTSRMVKDLQRRVSRLEQVLDLPPE